MLLAQKKYLWIAISILMQLCICMFAGTCKKSFFCDEIYSYGLANSKSYTFIDPKSAEQYDHTGWVNEEYFKQYIEVGRSDSFSLDAAIKNQEQDVHPPFYYVLLYIVCFLFRGSFSKWTGLGLNYVILVLTDLILLYIASYIFSDIKKQLCVMMVWSCSAAGLSNILFIRMYLLLTCEMLAFAAIHVRVLRKKGSVDFEIRDNILLLLCVAIGGLTHYYFYPFVFFFSGCICIYLLVRKQIAALIKYTGFLLGGFLLALAVFPGTIRHLQEGYRVSEVLKNLSGREENVYAIYLHWADQAALGGCFKMLVLVFAAIMIWIAVNRYFFSFRILFDDVMKSFILRIKKVKRKWTDSYYLHLNLPVVFILLLLIAFAGFGIIAVKGSQIKHNRYIYPLYPMIALLFVCTASFCIRQLAVKKHEGKILYVISIWICLCSIRTYGIDFMYSDYEVFQDQAEQVRGNDCLLLYGDHWLDTYTALPLKQIYNETYFLHPSEIGELPRILRSRKTVDLVVVCLPDAYSNEDANKILVQIEEAGGYKGHHMVYHYYTQAYLLE